MLPPRRQTPRLTAGASWALLGAVLACAAAVGFLFDVLTGAQWTGLVAVGAALCVAWALWGRP